MRSARKPDPYISWGVTLSVVLFVLYVYPGLLSPVEAHFDGTCRTITLSASAEDVRIDDATGLAYLSYYDRSTPNPARTRTGTVMLVDLNATEPRARAALTTEPPDFVPFGMSLYVPETGPKRLFVVSRGGGPGKHSIEIFEQSVTGAFTPVETIRDALLWSPNGIVAVGPRQFYVTNDSGFKVKDGADPKRYTQGRLRRNRSTVLYFDGTNMKQVATRLNMANGVAVSRKGDVVYVAESGDRQVRVFDRDATTGDLKPRSVVDLDAGPDNLTVDKDDSVWIAAHPRAIALMRNLDDSTNRAPTQVLKFTPGADEKNQLAEIYMNDGEQISAGSVAAPHGDSLVIGSVTDQKLLLCSRPTFAVEAATTAR